MSYASQLYDNREDYQSWYPAASDEYPPISEQASSNRARLDSGSYSNSSGSTNDSKKSKRRSHRPRGCRGGGARRARKALREQARAREALQENVNTGKQADFPPKYVTSLEERGKQQQPYPYGPRAPSPAPSLQPCMSTLSNDSSSASYTASADLFNIFTPHTTTTTTSTTNPHQYVDSQGHTHNRVPYGQMTFSDSQQRCGKSGASLATSESLMHPPLATFIGGGFVNVLPPLPVEEAEQEPETFEGPNPYSLKSNLRPDVHPFEPPPSILRPDADMYDPSFDSCLSNMNVQQDTTNNNSDDQQRTLIERQLNMGADSLFVTSPRSFLTGRKGHF